jgi:hypothetical protein
VRLQRKGCNNDSLNFSYAKLWIVHKLVTTKDEGCKVNTNKGYAISKWDTKEQLVVSVQMQTPWTEHLTSKRIKSL